MAATAEPRRQTRSTRDTELPVVDCSPVEPETARGRRWALTGALVLTLGIVLWIARPLWVGISCGMLLAFTVQPAFRRLAPRIGDRRALASAIVTIATGALLVTVGALASYLMAAELVALGGVLRHRIESETLSGIVGESVARIVDRIGLHRASVVAKLREELGVAASYAAAAGAVVVQAATSAILGLMVALVTMYYVLLDWRVLALRLERILPLDPRHTRALILEFRDVGRTVVLGTLATAIVQGLLGGIAYACLGVPHPVTWMVITVMSSFVPVLGTSLGWAPPAVYLVSSGHVVAGVGLLLWGFLVVMTGTIYVIRPRLVGGKVGHPLLVLVALLGGIAVLGLPGLVVAPVLMSLFVAVLRIYEREISKDG